jgi:hypothetical protein
MSISREDQMDVRPGFENGYGDVGFVGEDDIRAGPTGVGNSRA